MFPPFLGFFFTKQWWYFGVFRDEGTHWETLYRRGWMQLTRAEAEAEFVDLMEAYWDIRGSKFMWRWESGRGAVLERNVP